MNRGRVYWAICLTGIIVAGILSRVLHTGWRILDKYLGDALYAAMVYAILRLVWPLADRWRIAASAMAIMTALEFFQLTLLPAHLLLSKSALVRIAARLMGTEFSWYDLCAYAIGIFGIHLCARISQRSGYTAI